MRTKYLYYTMHLHFVCNSMFLIHKRIEVTRYRGAYMRLALDTLL